LLLPAAYQRITDYLSSRGGFENRSFGQVATRSYLSGVRPRNSCVRSTCAGRAVLWDPCEVVFHPPLKSSLSLLLPFQLCPLSCGPSLHGEGKQTRRNTSMTLCAKTPRAGWHRSSFGTYNRSETPALLKCGNLVYRGFTVIIQRHRSTISLPV